MIAAPESGRIPAEALLQAGGAALVAAWAGWMWLSAFVAEGNALPSIALLAIGAGVFAVARRAAAYDAAVVPAAVVVATVLLIALSYARPGTQHAIEGPLSYANASGALFVQTTAAAVVLAVTTRAPAGRVIGGAAACAAIVLTLATGSAAASILAGAVGVSGAVASRYPQVVLGTAMAGVAVTLAATVWLGATYSEADTSRAALAERSLSTQRLSLWRDALGIISEHPLGGVGPGRFEEVSPTARADRDMRWAHNEFLEQGAETGVIGLALMLAAVAWAFLVLLSAGASPVTAVAGAAVAAVGIQASIDYVLHFPPVPLAAIALVGSASRTQSRGSWTG